MDNQTNDSWNQNCGPYNCCQEAREFRRTMEETDAIDPSPALRGMVSMGISFVTSTGLHIAVINQTRLLLVFTATEERNQLINTIIGYASAGIAIS